MAVELDDGTFLEETIDQRDFAKAEVSAIDPDQMKHTWIRYLSFCAVTRTGKYKGTWERFNDVDCVEAKAKARPAADDADDPGQPDRGAGS